MPWLLIAGSVLAPPPSPDGTSILGLPPLCALRWVTGIACPGCGMVRSLVCCGHGDFGRAIAFHPLGPVVFVGIVAWAGLTLFQRSQPGWQPSKTQRTWFHRVCLVGLITTVCLWPVRLLGWIPPAP